MTGNPGPQRPFVTPGEWFEGLPVTARRPMAVGVVAEALADAADEFGVVRDFRETEFYCRHVARVLNRDLADTDVVTPLVYDRFSALALTDAINALLHQQLLEVHGTEDGNMDSAVDGDRRDTLDYRLALPHIEPRTARGQ